MKKKPLPLMLFLSLMLLITAAAPVFGAEAAAVTEEAAGKPIRIGYMDYGSFIELDETGEYTGFGVEFLEEISNYTGWTYEYVYDTWANLLTRLKNHDIDFLGTPQKTLEREEIYDFADQWSGVEQTIIYTRLGNSDIYYNDFAAMDGKRVGLLRGSYQTDFFEEYAKRHGFTFIPLYYNTDEEMKAALKSGAIDLVAGGSLAMSTDLKVVGKEGADPFYWMTFKGNDKVLSQLNKAMAQILNEDPYYSSKLMEKYYGNSVVTSQPQFTRDEARYIALNPSLRVGIYEDAYPLCRYNEKTEAADGVLVDIMNMIAEETGFHVSYVPIPLSAQVEDGLLAGDYDVFLLYSQTGYTPNSLLLLSNSYFSSTMLPVIRTGTSFRSDEQYKVALIRNYNATLSFLKSLVTDFIPLYYETVDECLSAVQSGKADLFLNDTYVAAYHLKSPYFEHLEEDFGHTVSRDYCFTTLRSNRMLMDVLNAAINALDENLVNDTLAMHTYGSNYRYTFREWLYNSRILIFVMLLTSALIIGFLGALVAVQKKAVREIEEKNKDLEIATRAKQDFLSNMSHEIRTPLNGIKGSLDILIGTGGFDEETTRLLTMSAASADHLSNLVNDILDMSKLESGKLELRSAWFSTQHFIENVEAIIEPLASAKRIRFSIRSGDNFCEQIRGDRSRLMQITINILSNSIKYTPEGGLVDFVFSTIPISGRSMTGTDMCTVTIISSDNGIGMSEEFLANAFEPFAQEATSETRTGTGLGLSITKSLVTLMEGRLDIKSRIGEGTTATISIVMPCRGSKDSVLSEEFMPRRDTAPSFDGELHLLLAEDNDINRDIARIQAERSGFIVDTAENGKEALDIFATSPVGYYRIILMDIMMPVMDGLTAAREIRVLDRKDAKSVYIVAMTANAYAEDIDRSIESGMDSHLSKPFREADLKKLFRDVASSRGLV